MNTCVAGGDRLGATSGGGLTFELELALPRRVDVAAVRAKWSKRKQALTIKAPFAG
jgi:hypothetical protein